MNRITPRSRQLRNTLAVAIALGAGTLSAATAAPADYAALAKDVRLLGKVLEESTAVESPDGRHSRRGARIEGLYLAGQGMLFEVRLGGAHYMHDFDMPVSMPLPPVPPVPPVPATGAFVADGADLVIDDDAMDGMIEEAMDDAEMVMDGFEGSGSAGRAEREQMRTLRRALGTAANDYAERQRAWAEAVRNDKGNTAARDKLRAEAEASRQRLEAARKQLRERSAALREQQRQQWQARVQQAEAALLDTLCSYAASTRRLGAGEHVSLVIENANSEGDDRRRVWVVRKADLDACAGGSQASDFLHKKAQSYLM